MPDDTINMSPHVYKDWAEYNRARVKYLEKKITYEKTHGRWSAKLTSIYISTYKRYPIVLNVFIVLGGAIGGALGGVIAHQGNDPPRLEYTTTGVIVGCFIGSILSFKAIRDTIRTEISQTEKQRLVALYHAENPEPYFDETEPQYVPDENDRKGQERKNNNTENGERRGVPDVAPDVSV